MKATDNIIQNKDFKLSKEQQDTMDKVGKLFDERKDRFTLAVGAKLRVGGRVITIKDGDKPNQRSQHDNKGLIISSLRHRDGRICNQKSGRCQRLALFEISLREGDNEYRVMWDNDMELCDECLVIYLNQDYPCKDDGCDRSFNTWQQLEAHKISLSKHKYHHGRLEEEDGRG